MTPELAGQLQSGLGVNLHERDPVNIARDPIKNLPRRAAWSTKRAGELHEGRGISSCSPSWTAVSCGTFDRDVASLAENFPSTFRRHRPKTVAAIRTATTATIPAEFIRSQFRLGFAPHEEEPRTGNNIPNRANQCLMFRP